MQKLRVARKGHCDPLFKFIQFAICNNKSGDARRASPDLCRRRKICLNQLLQRHSGLLDCKLSQPLQSRFSWWERDTNFLL